MTTSDTSFRLGTAVAGAVGVVILIGSFFVNPGPPPGADLAEVMAFGRQHASTVMLAGWMQGMGSLLNVLFVLGLMELAGAARTLAGRVALLSGVGILATSLAECGLYFAAIETGRGGDGPSVLTILALIKGLQHVYLVVPALLLPVGWTVVRRGTLPRAFGAAALAIGAALQLLGPVGLLAPGGVQPVVDDLLVVQGVWFLAASVALGARAPRPAHAISAAPHRTAVAA